MLSNQIYFKERKFNKVNDSIIDLAYWKKNSFISDNYSTLNQRTKNADIHYIIIYTPMTNILTEIAFSHCLHKLIAIWVKKNYLCRVYNVDSKMYLTILVVYLKTKSNLFFRHQNIYFIFKFLDTWAYNFGRFVYNHFFDVWICLFWYLSVINDHNVNLDSYWSLS